MPLPPPVALSIAGFDPSSGAGVTADLAVFAAQGLFGTSAITSRTVQSTRGVAGREESSVEHLAQSLGHLTADLPPAGVKIGALGNRELAAVIGEFLGKWAHSIPIVWDPALVSSSGYPLLAPDAVPYLHEELLPSVGWVTPNWAELALLTGLPVRSLEQAEAAATAFGNRHLRLSIVVTGGDQPEPIDLLRTPAGRFHRFTGERVESTSTHGTGCAFSSALLAGLILGRVPAEAVQGAKDYVTEAIRRAPGLGSGRGPLDLYWPLKLQPPS